MKIRYGFVSNSSSSSFCIAKCYMTEKQIDEMRKIVEPFGYETNKYFCGTYSTEDVCFEIEEHICDACEDVDCDDVDCDNCNCDDECENIINNFNVFTNQFGDNFEEW